MKRRAFLMTVAGAAGVTALGAPEVFAGPPAETVAGLPRRLLGRTGQKLSVVGFPGLALNQFDQEKGTAALRDAFERGVNYFDVAPAYGEAQTRMGIGLKGLDRSIEAAKRFAPLDAPAIEKLKQMAANRGSLFLPEEKQVALNLPHWTPVHPHSPHESG
jgi:hypothetical protein